MLYLEEKQGFFLMSSNSSSFSLHHDFMRQAIALADQARLLAPPNPWVGCIIVKNGNIVGRGFTQPPGHAHAEIMALNEAKEKAEGATLYVTLEPCAHTGRTPPCTQAIIQAGIKELYFGVYDPDPRVKGKGARLLQKEGVNVFQGICEEEIKTLLAPYLYQRTTSLPYTILKAAVSLDGRVAAADYTSQWISSKEAREDAHFLRATSQAIVIGARTALHDSPRLTVRLPSLSHHLQPLRVLLDAKGIVPPTGPLFDQHLAPTLIFTTTHCPIERRKEWESVGAEVQVISSSPEGINLKEAWQELGKRSILQLLVEGGANLQTTLLETDLVNHLILYMGPIFLGSSGIPLYQKQIKTLMEAKRFHPRAMKMVGESVRLDFSLAIPAGYPIDGCITESGSLGSRRIWGLSPG